jgi:branched-chain amino acid transport system substrate-binding protein
MRKAIWAGILILAVAVGVISYEKDGDKDGRAIKIGAILPLTDFGAFWGELTKAGMDMAVSDLAKEGIDVEILYEDSKGRGDLAVNAAQKLINIDAVDVVYTDFSGPSSAVSPVARAANKPFAYSSFDPAYVATNEFAVKTFFDAVGECKRFSEYLKSKGIKKTALIGVNLAFTEPCADEMREVFGNENVIVESVSSPSIVDFRSPLLKAKSFGAEFLYGIGYEANYKAIFEQKSELGIDIPVFCNLSDCYTKAVKESVSPKSVEGSVFFDYFLEDDFRDRVIAAVGADKNYRGVAFAYDIVQYLARAVDECGGSDDPKCVVDAIAQNKDYKPVVPGRGFGGDRVFDVESSYILIKDGKEVAFKP